MMPAAITSKISRYITDNIINSTSCTSSDHDIESDTWPGYYTFLASPHGFDLSLYGLFCQLYDEPDATEPYTLAATPGSLADAPGIESINEPGHQFPPNNTRVGRRHIDQYAYNVAKFDL